MTTFPVRLVGDGMLVPCVDGNERPYVALDTAASTGALEPVLRRVNEFLPVYSAVHRGFRPTLMRMRVRQHSGLPGAKAATTSLSSVEIRPKPSTIWPTAFDCVPTTSWSPPSRSTTPTSCRGPAWRRAATSSASPTGPSPQPMSWPNWTGPPSRDCSPSPLPQISPGGYRRSTRSSMPLTAGGSQSPWMPPSWRLTGHYPKWPISSLGADTRCTHRSVREYSSALATHSRTVSRFWSAAARSTS